MCAGASPSCLIWCTLRGVTAWWCDTRTTTRPSIVDSSYLTWPPGVACCTASMTSGAHRDRLPTAHLWVCRHSDYTCATLRREDHNIVACTLLDGGSGTELVTGSVVDGQLNPGSLRSHTYMSQLWRQKWHVVKH